MTTPAAAAGESLAVDLVDSQHEQAEELRAASRERAEPRQALIGEVVPRQGEDVPLLLLIAAVQLAWLAALGYLAFVLFH